MSFVLGPDGPDLEQTWDLTLKWDLSLTTSISFIHVNLSSALLIFIFYKVCLLVCNLPSFFIVGALIHQTGTALIRYMFVRSSPNIDTQLMMKRGRFVAFAIFIPQVQAF